MILQARRCVQRLQLDGSSDSTVQKVLGIPLAGDEVGYLGGGSLVRAHRASMTTVGESGKLGCSQSCQW